MGWINKDESKSESQGFVLKMCSDGAIEENCPEAVRVIDFPRIYLHHIS